MLDVDSTASIVLILFKHKLHWGFVLVLGLCPLKVLSHLPWFGKFTLSKSMISIRIHVITIFKKMTNFENYFTIYIFIINSKVERERERERERGIRTWHRPESNLKLLHHSSNIILVFYCTLLITSLNNDWIMDSRTFGPMHLHFYPLSTLF